MAKMKWTDEQKRIINNRGNNILVSAAAGSGKTTVLVERIFQRIMDERNPIDIDRFVVVTFTRAAAAEMKQRLRDRIEEELEQQPGNSHLQRQVALLPKANISTVHSFCGFVIQNYFHRIGIDPAYRQGSDSELQLMKKDVMNALLEREYQGKKEDFMELISLNCFNKGDAELEKTIDNCYKKLMSEPFPYQWLEEKEQLLFLTETDNWEQHPAVQYAMKEVKKIVESIPLEVEKLRAICELPAGPDKYLTNCDQLEELGERLCGLETFEQFYEVFSTSQYPKLSQKKDGDIDLDLKELFQNNWNGFKDLYNKCKNEYFYQDAREHCREWQMMQRKLGCLLRLTKQFMEDFAEAKREKGIIDFNDLEQFAIRILLQWEEEKGCYVPTEAAKELANYFDEIMIDEYQDSNRIQDTILTSVSHEGMADKDPNLFLVGDVKQCIYRFRNACPELFGEKMISYKRKEKNERIDLHQNFRSRDIVLKASNAVFQEIMHEDLGDIEYDEAAELVRGRKFEDTGQNVADKVRIVLGMKKDDNEAMVSKISSKDEAHMIVMQILEMTNEKNPLYVEEKGVVRPVRYRDIAILCRSLKTFGEPLISALKDAGIPVVMERKGGFFDTREIQLMTQMLQVIDNPTIDMALVAVLLSPMFGFDKNELAILRGQNRKGSMYESLEAYATPGDLYDKVQHVLHVIETLREKSTYEISSHLIQDIYDETGIYEAMMTMSNGVQRIANMDYLMEQAREFESTSFHGLHQFVKYIEKIKSQTEEIGEINLAGEEENVVRVMTIHKSKGLEFPVCILARAGADLMKKESDNFPVDSEFGLISKWYDVEKELVRDTLYRSAYLNKNEMEMLAENMRILYVAMTRAKEQLIVTGVVDKLPGGESHYMARLGMKTYLEMLYPAVIKYPEYFDVTFVGKEDLLEVQAEKFKTDVEEIKELYTFDTSVRYDEQTWEMLEESRVVEEPEEAVPVKVSVSELKESAMEQLDDDTFHVIVPEEEPEEPIPSFMQEEGMAKNENKGASYGTIWHQVMATIDFGHVSDEAQIEESVARIVEEGKLLQEDTKVLNTRRLHVFFQSPLGQEMRQAYTENKLYREQPFVIRKSAKDIWDEKSAGQFVLVQGIIDGYYETEAGIVLMDYKTDKLEPGQENKLIDRYKTQMYAYRDAIESMTGKNVVRCELYSFSLGKSIRCPL